MSEEIRDENVCSIHAEGSRQRLEGLRCQDEAPAGLADDGELPVIGKGGIGSGDDLLRLVGEHENEILLLHLLNVLKAHLQVHVGAELDEGVDVNALRLKSGRYRDAEQLAVVELVKVKSGFLRAKDFRDPRVQEGGEEVVDVGDNASERFVRLLEVMGEILGESFRFGVWLVEREIMTAVRASVLLMSSATRGIVTGALVSRRASRQC